MQALPEACADYNACRNFNHDRLPRVTHRLTTLGVLFLLDGGRQIDQQLFWQSVVRHCTGTQNGHIADERTQPRPKTDMWSLVTMLAGWGTCWSDI